MHEKRSRRNSGEKILRARETGTYICTSTRGSSYRRCDLVCNLVDNSTHSPFGALAPRLPNATKHIGLLWREFEPGSADEQNHRRLDAASERAFFGL